MNILKEAFDAEFERKFQEASKPLIKFLAENMHPHCHAEVDATKSILHEASLCFNTTEFVLD